MKLLSFTEFIKVDEFFNKIRNKYMRENNIFFDYFNKAYFINSQFNDKSWNYSSYYNKQENK